MKYMIATHREPGTGLIDESSSSITVEDDGRVTGEFRCVDCFRGLDHSLNATQMLDHVETIHISDNDDDVFEHGVEQLRSNSDRLKRIRAEQAKELKTEDYRYA